MRITLFLMLLIMTSCGQNITGVGQGFGGEIKLSLKIDKDQIKDIVIISQNETPCLMDRAFPVLKERIISANTPLVDNVSGATYSSFGVKMAVAKAMESAKLDAPKITIHSKGVEKPETTIEDVYTDLLIVGGGPAGISTALTAFENGVSNIILIEKLDILSGNGKFDKNFFDMVNTEGQRKAGIQDSADKFYEDMIARYRGDDTNRLRVLADYSATTDAWLRTHNIQLDFAVGRSHQVSEEVYAGDHIQRGLETSLSNTTVDVRTGTQGLDLVLSGNEVDGIRVKNNNNEYYTIYAKAVMIATGGFSANNELVAKQNSQYAKFITSNQEQNKGDFIPVFEKHGIAINNLDVFSLFSYTVVKNRALTGSSEADVDFILVNKNGTRFVSEKGVSGSRFADAMLQQPDHMAYYVFDDVSREAGPRIRVHIREGYGIEGKTLDELAQKMGVDATVFAKTIEDYNKTISGEMPDPFGKPTFKRAFASEGPFFAIAVRPAVHMTKGGVVVNAKGEVQSVNKSTIKGLYAAGEVTDILDGAYMASVALARATADNISEYLAPKILETAK